MSFDDTPLHFDVHGMRERERVADGMEKKLDHELEISEKSDVVGRVGTNASAQNSAKQAEQQKKREKQARDRFDAVYLAMLNDMHDYGQAEIDAANAQMDAQNILQDLHDKGLLDPDNPDHARYFKDAGLDPEEYRKRGQDALDDNKIRIDARRDRGYRIQGDVAKAREGSVEAQKRLAHEAKEVGNEEAAQVFLQNIEGNELVGRDVKVDGETAQVDIQELKAEVREQLDYSADEVEREEIISEQKAADGSDLGGFSLDSLMASENPISTPHTPTTDFNTVAKDVVTVAASLETDMQADHTANINAPEQAEIPLGRTM